MRSPLRTTILYNAVRIGNLGGPSGRMLILGFLLPFRLDRYTAGNINPSTSSSAPQYRDLVYARRSKHAYFCGLVHMTDTRPPAETQETARRVLHQ